MPGTNGRPAFFVCALPYIAMRSRPGVCSRTDVWGLWRHAEASLSAAHVMHPHQQSSLQPASPDAAPWRDLLKLPGASFLRLDDAGRIMDASAALCQALGRTPDALTGRLLASVSHWPADRESVERVAQLLRLGYLRYGDLPLAGGDGTPRQFSFHRVARMADDSQVVECRPRPERTWPASPRQGVALVAGREVLDARDIERAADRECAQTRRHGAPLSVLRLSIDRRKRSAGAGKPMRDFDDYLLGLLRTRDIVGRLDAQGYIVLLPGTAARSALRTAERLRTAISAWEGGPEARGITVSIGVVTTRTGRAPFRTLRARAETKCEEALSNGGNRVIP